MELLGQVDLNATPEVIWAALFDPVVLQGCFPGCKSVERKSESEYAAVLQVRVGPLNAGFNGLITLTDPEYLTAVTLAGTLNGAGAGFARGTARITLQRRDPVTELSYSANCGWAVSSRRWAIACSAPRSNATSRTFSHPSLRSSMRVGSNRPRA